MRIDDAGQRMISQFEGCVLTKYRDKAGAWTIGFGHALTRAEIASGTYDNVRLSRGEAWELFLRDLSVYDAGVSELTTIETTQPQHNALVSFAFNVGLGGFETSTLRRWLNNGFFEQASTEFARWNKITTQDPDGRLRLVEWSVLTERRAVERKLFLTGTITIADIARVRIAQEDAIRSMLDADPTVSGLVHAGE